MTDAIVGQFIHIVSRQSARIAGLESYFTGEPCGKGHYSQRSVKRRACRACEQEYRDKRKGVLAEYKRQYHIENKEDICRKSREWYAANKERAAEYSRDYYQKNKDRCAARNKAWSSENPERKRDRHRQWLKDNSVKVRAVAREWKRSNPNKVLAHNRNRRSMAKGAEGTHTAQDVESIYSLQRGKCAHCRKNVGSKFHVDHITPLAKGGSNWPHNLQILCPKCNLSKSSKDPFEWRQQHGMLL